MEGYFDEQGNSDIEGAIALFILPCFYKQLPKPDYGKSTTAKISLRPAQAFTEDTSIPIEDMGRQIEDVQTIQFSEVNFAYVNRPESDIRGFAEFKRDWEADQKQGKINKAMELLKGEEDADIIQ